MHGTHWVGVWMDPRSLVPYGNRTPIPRSHCLQRCHYTGWAVRIRYIYKACAQEFAVVYSQNLCVRKEYWFEQTTRQNIKAYTFISGSPVSVVGIATGYGLDDRGFGVRILVGAIIFSSPRRPDWLWGPPSLLFNGYWRLTTHLQLVSRSRKYVSIHPLPHTPSWHST
jgi:hypothetical protein